jgi:glycosyltransferase involved in cell wall biosynthesis
MKQLSLIIPAYNEEHRIKSTILNYENKLREKFKSYEIIIVLNGCSDNTLNIIKELQAKTPKLKFINYEQPIGKGGAIIEGMKYADGAIVGFVDADDAFSIQGVIRLMEDVESGTDCVIASKWKNQSFRDVTEPNLRKVLSRGWNVLVRTLLGLNYEDTQAGAKFCNRKVVEGIGYDFISRDFTFDAELLYKIKKKRYRIKEVYVPSKHIKGSTFKIKHSIPMFTNLLKIWWSK